MLVIDEMHKRQAAFFLDISVLNLSIKSMVSTSRHLTQISSKKIYGFYVNNDI